MKTTTCASCGMESAILADKKCEHCGAPLQETFSPDSVIVPPSWGVINISFESVPMQFRENAIKEIAEIWSYLEELFLSTILPAQNILSHDRAISAEILSNSLVARRLESETEARLGAHGPKMEFKEIDEEEFNRRIGKLSQAFPE